MPTSRSSAGHSRRKLAAAIADAVDRAQSVPLLVLRGAGYACVAREGDALAYERRNDRLVVALLGPPRGNAPPGAAQFRVTLNRIAGALALSTGRMPEAGWCNIATRDQLAVVDALLDEALIAGARERVRNETMATLGHELRTPLTSIRGYIETLLDEELDRTTTRRFLETARREAQRLGRMVEGMLEFSLLDLNATPDDAYCDVAEQIRATIDAALPIARERRVTIRARVPAQAVARIDADACMHALLNVVENAIKHGREGGVVEISCERVGAFVSILIDDDGPGIAAAEREAVFRMGIRGASMRPGSGIGLAIVRAIIARAGGNAGVTDSHLGGARVVLRFLG